MTGSLYSELMRESSHKAHRALFDEYCNYVYTVVYNKLRSSASREDIEECVSDVFAQVFRELDCGGRYDGELRGFIAAVAKCRAIDRYRRHTADRVRIVSVEEDGISEIKADVDIEEDAIRKQQQEIILEKIKELGEPDSSIIICRYYYNKTSADTAALLSMKPSAVRMRCSRALKRLRESLAAAEIYF